MADEVGSWSRAFMASSGMAMGRPQTDQRAKSAEWHEAVSVDLARNRLVELSMSRSSAIREAIAARTDCPLGVLATLAHDHRPAVRADAAANPTAARAILEHLAGDRDTSVVKAVARNHATPPDLLDKLLTHRKDEVRRVAERTRANASIVEDSQQRAPGATRAPTTLAPRPHVKDSAPRATSPITTPPLVTSTFVPSAEPEPA